MFRFTKLDGTVVEVDAEDAARLLKGYGPLSLLDATMRPTPKLDFDGWLAFKPELFPAYWIVPERRERWCAVIRNRWVMGAAEGNPRQIMDEETFVKRLADAMHLPVQGPYGE